ncbi:MAG: hypothetical protein VX589_03925 [Myxococcota bacterium]|nr:hypothetical protein [Myxococcota bacterium]
MTMRLVFLSLMICWGCGGTETTETTMSGDTATSSSDGKADTQSESVPTGGGSDEGDNSSTDGDVCTTDDCEDATSADDRTEDDGEQDGIDEQTVPNDGSMTEDDEAEDVDRFAGARDVTLHRVMFDEDFEVTSYQYPASSFGMRLGGTEFWQKWPDGENPTYNFDDGTPYGRRCMMASAIRFASIMENAPETLKKLREDSNWSGSFFNWNDDFSKSPWGDGRGARLWAWRTSLIKWISQTNQDGSCYLPTLSMVEAAADTCLNYSDRSGGDIQGCSAR